MSLLDRAKLTGREPEPEPEPAPADQLGDVIELDADPEPGRRSRRRPREPKPAAARRAAPRSGGRFTSKDQIRAQIADEVNMYAKMLALAWSFSDPECGTVLSDESRKIADQISALAIRSDWIVENYETAGLFGDIVKVLHALMPVGRAIWAHHGPGRPKDDGGEVERVTVSNDYGAAPGGGVTYAPFRPAYPA